MCTFSKLAAAADCAKQTVILEAADCGWDLNCRRIKRHHVDQTYQLPEESGPGRAAHETPVSVTGCGGAECQKVFPRSNSE